MDLIKKNIHMDYKKADAVTQFALEEDMNVSDVKPDVNSIHMVKGEVVIEEIKPGTDMVTVRGFLRYEVLYFTTEAGCNLAVLEGKLPFHEKMNLMGAIATDTVQVEGETEDITVTTINTRKLNMRAVVTLKAYVEELYDAEVPFSLQMTEDEKAEYRKMPVELSQLTVCKNDIFRIKEEISLPAAYPNIANLLWYNASVGDVEFKPMEGKLLVSGDLCVSLLYEAEAVEGSVQGYEYSTPFSGELECSGSGEGMIPDIKLCIGQAEVQSRPDFDGEERNLGIEMVLEFGIHLYRDESVEVITDVYGVEKEIGIEYCDTDVRKLLAKVRGKTKVTGQIHTGDKNVLQLLYAEGEIYREQQTYVNNGVELQGSLCIHALYVSEDDNSPYQSVTGHIPYHYILEIPGLEDTNNLDVSCNIEQMQVTMSEGHELEVKAVLGFSTIAFRTNNLQVIKNLNVAELDAGKLHNLPGMVIYTVQPGDSLWKIGKKYYVTVDSLRRMNELTCDTIYPGQKLLIVR